MERNGGNVAACLSLGPSTPSKLTTGVRSVVSASRSTGKRSRTTARATPIAAPFIKRSESDDEDEEDDEEADFSGMDETPSKRTKTTGGPRRSRTPSRKAATQATATIAAAARLESSASPPEMSTPTPTHLATSTPLPVIGHGDSKPVVVDALFGHVESTHASYGGDVGGGSISLAQPSFEGGYQQGYYDGDEFDDGDGEI